MYVKNFEIGKIQNRQITYKIAQSIRSTRYGDSTLFTFDGIQIKCDGGRYGTQHGVQGTPGHGANLPDIFDILSNYTNSPDENIGICSNGGGSGGNFQNEAGHAGGGGASMSSNGNRSSGYNPGNSVENTDGTGGFNGGASQSYSGGTGRKINNVIIPIVSIFGGGGRGGTATRGLGSDGSGAGGGAAAYGSGGDGGAPGNSALGHNPTDGTAGGLGAGGGGGGGSSHLGGVGGQGIICLYYHS